MVALFVLLTFILFITADMLVLKAQKKKHPAFAAPESTADHLVFTNYNIETPEEYFVSKGHTWAIKNEYGLVKVGIDDFILKSLGRFFIKNTVTQETEVRKGDILFEGGDANYNFKFRSPVNGVVKFINTALQNKQVKDPYGDDWGVILMSTTYEDEKQTLYTGKEMKKWMKNEFSRLKEFLAVHSVRPELAGVTMHDGGNIVEGALHLIDNKGVEDFEKQFLSI